LFVHPVRTLLQVARGKPAAVGQVVVTVTAEQRLRVSDELRRHRLPAEVREAATWWDGVDVDEAGHLALVDPLCPLVPAWFVEELLGAARADRSGRPHAAYRPVTDTIKTVVDQQIAGTVDRDQYAIVASPVVLSRHLAASGRPPMGDFAELLTWLRARSEVVMVKAPSMARRVDDESAVSLLECLDEIGRVLEER
jgi:2-C-methyl-D-erythritol 4-phosphate cytidylyltransferase